MKNKIVSILMSALLGITTVATPTVLTTVSVSADTDSEITGSDTEADYMSSKSGSGDKTSTESGTDSSDESGDESADSKTESKEDTDAGTESADSKSGTDSKTDTDSKVDTDSSTESKEETVDKHDDPPVEGNMVKSGDFTSSDGWDIFLEDGDGDFSVTDGEMLLNIRNTGTVDDGVQLYYDGFKLARGCTYRISFDASCDIERPLTCRAQINRKDYHSYAIDTVTVGPEKKHFEVEFTMTEKTDKAPRLCFDCGYWEGADPTAVHTIHLDNVTVLLIDGDDSEKEELNIITTSRLGYQEDAKKLAVFKNPDLEEYSIVDVDSGDVVYTGMAGDEEENEASGETLLVADFSDLVTPGSYQIVADEVKSAVFTISDTVYDDTIDEAFRVYYLQRCGKEVKDDTFGHKACHTEKAKDYETGKMVDVSGGWHDAGDYGRYVVAAAKSVSDLMLAYERYASLDKEEMEKDGIKSDILVTPTPTPSVTVTPTPSVTSTPTPTPTAKASKPDSTKTGNTAKTAKSESTKSGAGAANTKTENAESGAGAVNTKTGNAESGAGAVNSKPGNAKAGSTNTNGSTASSGTAASEKKVLPEILEETRYELEWMLRMQTEEGSVHHKVTTAKFPSVIMPEDDKDELILLPVSSTATADYAAAMAMAARVYEPFDREFANICLDAAKTAATWLEKNPEDTVGFRNPSDISTGEYEDTNDTDERYWAFAELYKTTGDKKYLNDLKPYTEKTVPLGLGWQAVGLYGEYAVLTSDAETADKDLCRKVEERFFKQVDSYVAKSGRDSYGVSLSADDYIWGSNMSVANNGMAMIMAAELLEDAEDDTDVPASYSQSRYVDSAQMQLAYLTGNNTNNMSFVTGDGEGQPKNPHHRISQVMDKAIPGMLVGGPDSGLEDDYIRSALADAAPAACYADNDQSYSTNEVTIYWNSPFLNLMTGVNIYE